MNLPYVYKLTHKETNQFYIGYRAANKVRSFEDLGFKYFSSSKQIEKLGFENFNIEILAEFIDSKHAYEFEQLLINENFKDPLCLNKSCYYNKKHFKISSQTEETKNKISITKTGKFQSESHKRNRAASKRIFSMQEELMIFSMFKSGMTRQKLNLLFNNCSYPTICRILNKFR